MRIEYNKLVRDRIPEIIHREGRDCGVETLPEEAYRQALHAKLIEEGQELAQAPREEIVKEMADVREVLDALIAHYGVNESELQAMQARRRAERGGFENRLNLLWTE